MQGEPAPRDQRDRSRLRPPRVASLRRPSACICRGPRVVASLVEEWRGHPPLAYVTVCSSTSRASFSTSTGTKARTLALANLALLSLTAAAIRCAGTSGNFAASLRSTSSSACRSCASFIPEAWPAPEPADKCSGWFRSRRYVAQRWLFRGSVDDADRGNHRLATRPAGEAEVEWTPRRRDPHQSRFA